MGRKLGDVGVAGVDRVVGVDGDDFDVFLAESFIGSMPMGRAFMTQPGDDGS